MGFEIGKNVQSSDITLQELKDKLGDDQKLQQKANTIFEQFNTNKTANSSNQQVLDKTEQVALMSFFKEIAMGKKDDIQDGKISRKDLKNFKKENKNNKAMSFIQDLGYKDMKKIMQAFSGVVDADDTDNQALNGFGHSNGNITSVQVGHSNYQIDDNNRVTTDNSGTTYTYADDGDLQQTKSKDGVVTTDFNDDGVRSKTTESKQYITINGQKFDVKDGKVTIEGTEYTVQDGKVNINGQEYTVNNQTDEKTFQADGNTLKQQVFDNHLGTVTTNYDEKGVMTDDTTVDKQRNTTTTNTYYTGGEKVQKSVVENRTNNTTTTTRYAHNGDRLREDIVDSSENPPKTTTTKYHNNSHSLRVITQGEGENKKETVIDYSQKQITTTQGDLEIVQNFNEADKKTGNIDSKDITKTVTTNKKNHTRETTETSTPHLRTVEFLDDNNKTTTRTVAFDQKTGKAEITVGGKKISLTLNGNQIVCNSKFMGTRYENIGETAVRLGYPKGSAEYNAIVKANGGNPNTVVRQVNIDSANLDAIKKMNVDTAVVDEKAELKKYNINVRRNNAAKYAQQAVNNYNSKHDNKLRETWASGNHQVFCDTNYSDTAQTYQQHYVYDPVSNSMVKLEGKLGLGAGEHINRITEDGFANVVSSNGTERQVKINFTSLKASNATTADYNNSFTSSATKGAKGKISGTVDKNKHKYVYQGENRTDVLTGEKSTIQTYQKGNSTVGIITDANNSTTITTTDEYGREYKVTYHTEPDKIAGADTNQLNTITAAGDKIKAISFSPADEAGGGYNIIAEIHESHGMVSYDAHFKIKTGPYAGDYKFRVDDGDHLNYGKFKTGSGGISVGNYNVTQLEGSNGKKFPVSTSGGIMKVNVNGKYYTLEQFASLSNNLQKINEAQEEAKKYKDLEIERKEQTPEGSDVDQIG